MDDSTERSVCHAQMVLYREAGNLYRHGQALCLNLLLLDRSGSMLPHKDTPLLAANECLQTLPHLPGAENSLVAVFTFGSDISLDVPPTPVKQMRPLTSYKADGGTKLFEAVYAALRIGLEFQAKAAQGGAAALVAISVITDGEDTASRQCYDAMLDLSAQARTAGFALGVTGIGIDGKHLSQLLGFEEGYAHTVANTHAGVHEASAESSQLFSISMLHSTTFGLRPPTPTAPKPPSSSKSGRPEDSDSTPTPV